MTEYLTEVYKMLNCNATMIYKLRFRTYHYTNEVVNKHIDYFIDCKEKGLQPSTALELFDIYLSVK